MCDLPYVCICMCVYARALPDSLDPKIFVPLLWEVLCSLRMLQDLLMLLLMDELPTSSTEDWTSLLIMLLGRSIRMIEDLLLLPPVPSRGASRSVFEIDRLPKRAWCCSIFLFAIESLTASIVITVEFNEELDEWFVSCKLCECVDDDGMLCLLVTMLGMEWILGVFRSNSSVVCRFELESTIVNGSTAFESRISGTTSEASSSSSSSPSSHTNTATYIAYPIPRRYFIFDSLNFLSNGDSATIKYVVSPVSPWIWYESSVFIRNLSVEIL